MGIGQDFKEFIELLNKHKVEYLVVGGYAVAMYGYPRYTGDIDFWVKPNSENAKKIVEALKDFGFGGYDISESDFTVSGLLNAPVEVVRDVWTNPVLIGTG